MPSENTEHVSKSGVSSSHPILLGLSFALWVSSLAFAALISPDPKHSPIGLNILLSGWLGVAGVEDGVNLLGVLAWWANPFYIWALSRSAAGKGVPIVSAYLAIAIASLTFLVSSYAINAVPAFTPIIGYGIGALLWFLALFMLAYVVSKDAGLYTESKVIACISSLFLIAFLIQVGWRALDSNDSEKERLPYYAAKRGPICSVTIAPLLHIEAQPVIELKAESEYWLESLLNWGIKAVQRDGIEYQKAPKGSPESQRPPYMISKPISAPARYILRAEGGYPYINKWSDGGDFVRLSLVDRKNNKELGHVEYRREANRGLGFCPMLTSYPHSKQEEAIKWLAPFVKAESSK
jgi:hypothetical protein